ncbi:MAG: endopeptidase La [Alphaproteobacteria bacterium]|nr:endopeptidase La [Alphaproteobacteria bacterium]MCL2505563.1 endopeptidase La [Alphaproteobacteria bacterium]
MNTQSSGGALHPVLPLRDIVVFPHMVVPLFVGREMSVNALDDVTTDDKQILMLTQRDPSQEDPSSGDLYEFGTIGTVLQMLKLPDGTVKVLVEGVKRARVTQFTSKKEFFQVFAEPVEDFLGNREELDAMMRAVLSQFDQYVRLNKKITPEVLATVNQITDPGKLADTIAAHISLKIADKQGLLETVSVNKRLESIFAYMESEIDVLQVEKKIRSRVKKQMEKTQRDYYLNEQMKAIQKELGEGEDGKNEADEYQKKIIEKKLPKEAKEKAESELKKLRNMSPMSAESTVVRNYLDCITGIPWHERTRVKKDLKGAEKILNEEHYGLEKVKDKILEYLAVQQRQSKIKGPILCLVGPPGVGKTSLGKSIAHATGRNFVRMSLGGLRDESEIRGHRRTYIGSMPGKIIQGMKKAKSKNPLFLLDEIDKLGVDWRGDPSAALLEVLDPEQNNAFNDHYLEVDYDLSDVMFVCTANTMKMSQPLLDRMDIIRLSGYTEDEKLEIAKRHLLPKIFKDNGVKKTELSISDDAIRDLIRYYTREAGVRSLERELANIARKSLKDILSGKIKTSNITRRNLEKYAGVKKYLFGEIEAEDLVGVTTGLAWTEVGGELLLIEAVSMPGKGKVTTTGKLGDVMKESVQAAESYVKARSIAFGLKPTTLDKKDIHVHVPEGATPKDGPSAGVAMVTSIVSVLTGIPVRRDVAMTGEITLRGRVLPIGGLKEKLLAALRGGIKTVLIPKENEKDLAEIPDNVKKGVNILFMNTVDDVLLNALVRPVTPIEWDEDEEQKIQAAIEKKKPKSSGVVAH